MSRTELCKAVENLLTMASYEEPLQELWALVEKRAALDEQFHPNELAANDAYAAIEDRIPRLHAQSQASLEAASAEELPTLLSGLSSDRMKTD